MKKGKEAEGDANSPLPVEPVPAGAPAWITPALIADTITTWQPYFGEALTAEDALEILQDVGHLIEILGNGPS